MSEVRSNDVNGKKLESGSELNLLFTANSSFERGRTLLNPCSCWNNAGLRVIRRESKMPRISFSA